MPGFQIVTQYPDVETDGGNVARNVMVVGTLTNDHGVYFERRYPRAAFKQANAIADARGFTIIFELLFDIDGVDAVTWGQQLNSANQLVDYVTVYYTSTSGDSSDYVATPFSQFTQDHIAAEVAAGRAHLDANEVPQ
jgi:hypothetical protein